MIEIHHIYSKNTDKKIYEAIYLDDILLVDWLTNGTVEINENHPAVKKAVHVNKFKNIEIK